ncbi:hypothetical protein BG015_010242 [Linnemannia schmuckeri]|uniref:Protein FRA10AC1 n=1 Tax=Linnemannia schmuckeri TaxID=64567 RepID=A0A9P5RUT6_9FUNG|nr:hypothetical protein BG015_010242 [Linnemannia schmuckeri]
MPQPQTQEVYRQGLGGMDAWTRHQHFIENYVKFYNDKSSSTQESRSITEREILHENHRFLRSESDDQDLTWEKRIAKKYYDKLFKEYALVELKYYKEGRVAMRWRNQNEVIRGKGQFTCGNLRCNESKGLESWEVNFGYVEQGEKKNALVKIRLCEKCSYKLNYKSVHKRANSSREEESVSFIAAPAAAVEQLRQRSRSSSRDRVTGGEAPESSRHRHRRDHESSTRSKRKSRSHSKERDTGAEASETFRRDHYRDHQELSKRRKSSRRDEDKADSRDRVKQPERSRSPLHRDHRRFHSTSDGHDKKDSRESRSHSRSKSAGDRERSKRSDVDDKKRGANYDRVNETIDADKSANCGSTADKEGDKRDTGKNEGSSEKPSSIAEFDRFFRGLFE